MKWRVVMLRKLAVFIVSAGLLISPLSVQALGFGGIKLKSSLNEKLNAEVDLISATANDIQSLTIKLATEEAFLRAGIDRTAQLNKLKFDVKERGNGDYYISITSTESMREPFMNFLLEMNWKNGRMLREYTMLIDPPGRGSAPKQLAEPAPVVAETTAPEAEPVMAEAVTPEAAVAEAKEQTPFVEPVAEPPMPEIMPEPVVDAEPAAEKMETTQAEAAGESAVPAAPVVDIPPEVVAPEEAAQTEEPPATEYNTFEDDGELWPRIPLTAFGESADAAGGEMGDLDYGITKQNDNLWQIAEKLR
ncbi:MAG: hypothetical protein OEW97_04440, partial [Gammaproteobacteria bacterium]|nr:hypothetical protein [Gammaproteobacteria bacterium]